MPAAADSAYAVAITDATGSTPAIPARPGRKRLEFRNFDDTIKMYWSLKAGVTSANGFPLLPNDVECRSRHNGLDCQRDIYVVCAAGENAELRVIEEN